MKLNLTKRLVQDLFGTESALGIVYVHKDGRRLTPDQVTEYYTQRGRPMDDLESEFPDGTDAVRCTHYAMRIYRSFPRNTQIFGFTNAANPHCEFARQELHPGGHDFAVVDDRWLIDPWVRHVACAYDEIVYDMDDLADKALVIQRYGNKENWRHMTGAEEHVASLMQGAMKYTETV